MGHVVALFRVLHVTDHGTKQHVAIAPTYATRDGQQSERNKSFSQWTPSGSGTIILCAGAAPDARAMFAPEAYLNLDFWLDDDVAPAPESIRTDWCVSALRLEPTQFVVNLETIAGPYKDGAHKNGRNRAFLGDGYGACELQMTVTNLAAMELFEFRPEHGAMAKRLVVDFALDT